MILRAKRFSARLALWVTRKFKDVRQGKFFVLALDGMTRDEAKTEVERIAKDVLTNPVIEEFRFDIVE